MKFWASFAVPLLCSMLVLAGNLSQADDSDDSNVWAGDHVRLEMTAQGATLEFDCAHGAISQPIKPNATGGFSVEGTYTPEHGGPIRRDETANDMPATYKGTIHGDTMQLEIVLADKTRQPPPLTLTRGATGKLMKCR